MATHMLGDNGLVNAGVPILVMTNMGESPVDVTVMVLMLGRGEIVYTKLQVHKISTTFIILYNRMIKSLEVYYKKLEFNVYNVAKLERIYCA
mmetsp:Transcript_39399/g.92006  ORF Transcript_39399/g.92006 Transcript_39399/m.92006 type:complete len:92 (+) Transcript_39399:2527-2802(+)